MWLEIVILAVALGGGVGLAVRALRRRRPVLPELPSRSATVMEFTPGGVKRRRL